MNIYNIDNIPANLYVGDTINCPYSGMIKSATFPAGSYLLQCWGAQGQNDGYLSHCGYSRGRLTLDSDTVLYCVVGGKANNNTGGYNGGGNGSQRGSSGGGGGATHIATSDGLLSSLSNIQSSILIVAGGGGGYGRTGGGGSGGGNVSTSSTFGKGTKGTTTSKTTEGSTTYYYGGGGGGGYYGGSGGKGNESGSQGGSGYIAPSLSVARTMTNSYTSDGNGNIVITYLGNSTAYASPDDIPASTRFKPGDEIHCGYTGTVKSVNLTRGIYKLECWGARGGNGWTNNKGWGYGGIGGKSVGLFTVKNSQLIYLVSGQKGEDISSTSSTNTQYNGGYNGGGKGAHGYYLAANDNHAPGGGATHIATAPGLLSALSNNKQSVLIVAGGGGGGGSAGGLLNDVYTGGIGGGLIGQNGATSFLGATAPTGGNTTNETGGAAGTSSSGSRYGTPGLFGQGGDGWFQSEGMYCGAGGGGGYYGGGGGSDSSGAGGSGYVSSLLMEASTIQGEGNDHNPDIDKNGYIIITLIAMLPELNAKVKVNGAWKKNTGIYIKNNNIWNRVEDLRIKDTNWAKTSNLATLIVDYPEGASCSCTDGIKTLIAPDTSGRAVFNIPYRGTWTTNIEYMGYTNSNTKEYNLNTAYYLNLQLYTAIPTLSGNYTYDGTVKTVTVNNIDNTIVAQTGSGSGIDSGDYTVYWDLKYPQFTWSDGTKSQKSATWTINKSSAAKVSVAPTSYTWSADGDYTFTITNPSGGTLSATSNSSNFTVTSLVGNVLTITASGQTTSEKTGTITITSAATDNYNASTCTIACTLSSSVCVTGDTLITLSDYSQKRIDELTYDDELLTYNLDTGEFEGKPISKLYYHGTTPIDVLKLNFSDGVSVKMIAMHGFLNCSKHEVSQITRDNVHDYIGDEFMLYDGSTVILESSEIVQETTGSWSLITVENENFITNGIVSMTGNRWPVFSINENMTYDADKKKEEIEIYGLFEYDEFADKISKEDFYDLNCQYYKIPLEKGLIDYEYIRVQLPILTEYHVVPKE